MPSCAAGIGCGNALSRPTGFWHRSRLARPGGMGGPGGMGMGLGNSRGWGTSLAALNNAQIHSPHPELRQLAAAMVRIQAEEIQEMERCYRLWYPATTKG